MSVVLRPDRFNPVARELTQGIAVHRATATLPQTTDEALFTVADGRVLLVDIVGEVTTAIQAQINNTKLKFNPTATGADTDLCAVLDIASDAVGTLYSMTGTAADALTSGLLVLTSAQLLARPVVLSEGDIELDCAASNTGSVSWSVVYVPLDAGATLTAA